MSNRIGHRRSEKLINKGLAQIRRDDYQPTKALRSLVQCSLELQPGLERYLNSILPPETNPEAFVLEGLREGYFQYLDEKDHLWLCLLDDQGTPQKII